MKKKDFTIELDEDFFRLYDKNKNVVGYFDPYYGDLHPKEMEDEIIETMIENKDVVSSGYLTVPLVKFGIYDVTDFASSIYDVDKQLSSAKERINQWKKLLESSSMCHSHVVTISHTNQDMLSITFHVKFQNPVSLDSQILLEHLIPILCLLQEHGLL